MVVIVCWLNVFISVVMDFICFLYFGLMVLKFGLIDFLNILLLVFSNLSFFIFILERISGVMCLIFFLNELFSIGMRIFWSGWCICWFVFWCSVSISEEMFCVSFIWVFSVVLIIVLLIFGKLVRWMDCIVCCLVILFRLLNNWFMKNGVIGVVMIEIVLR